MMSWAEIEALVAGRWPVTRRAATALLVMVEGDGQPRAVLVERSASAARPALVVVAEIGGGRLCPPEKALAYNATAERGALGLARGTLVLRQLLPLETLVPAQLADAIEAGAAEAARLRRLLSPAPPRPEVSRAMFAHIAD